MKNLRTDRAQKQGFKGAGRRGRSPGVGRWDWTSSAQHPTEEVINASLPPAPRDGLGGLSIRNPLEGRRPRMTTRPSNKAPSRRRLARAIRAAFDSCVVAAALVAAASPAAAEEERKPGAPPPDLKAVIDGFQTWLLGFATALAVLGLMVAGLFYLFSAGNPANVEKAKLIVRATVIGYSLMVLAPILLLALKSIVG